ncbi:hypothetical protein UlMin_020205 [Ulmus minor]
MKAWDKICVPKGDGGLGFRRMDDMNQALIAKWGWDLLTGKSSLCLSFLQAKYLRNGDFSAILHSKDLLLQGACKRIGDGHSINIWEDPWVPKCINFKPKPRAAPPSDARLVKDLIARPGCWSIPKIRALFKHDDAKAILALPLLLQPKSDSWFWVYNSYGKFTTRSAYLVSQSHRFSMASNIPRQLWLCIWRANIIPHHKLLWWQAVNDCFPTRDRLHKYIPAITNLCPFCGASDEIVLHLFFMCDFAKLSWFGSPWCI